MRSPRTGQLILSLGLLLFVASAAAEAPAVSPGPTAGVSPAPAFPVPPPNPVPSIPLPTPPPQVQVVARDPIQQQRLNPIVEVWVPGTSSPQVPTRHGRYLNRAYLLGSRPVLVRLQFDLAVAGKFVSVSASPSVILDSPSASLVVRPTGDCALSVRLMDGMANGYLRFSVDGMQTTLPLSRATTSIAAQMQAAKPETSR